MERDCAPFGDYTDILRLERISSDHRTERFRLEYSELSQLDPRTGNKAFRHLFNDRIDNFQRFSRRKGGLLNKFVDDMAFGQRVFEFCIDGAHGGNPFIVEAGEGRSVTAEEKTDCGKQEDDATQNNQGHDETDIIPDSVCLRGMYPFACPRPYRAFFFIHQVIRSHVFRC